MLLSVLQHSGFHIGSTPSDRFPRRLALPLRIACLLLIALFASSEPACLLAQGLAPDDPVVASSPGPCSNQLDDDADGLVDADDPACQAGGNDSETLAEYNGYSLSQLKAAYDARLGPDFLDSNNPRIGRISEASLVPYDLDPYLVSLVDMYEATQDEAYIDYALQKMEVTLASMVNLYGDPEHLEWIDHYETSPWRPGYTPAPTPSPAPTPRFGCLYTMRGVRSAPRIVRVIKKDYSLNSRLGSRADAVAAAIIRNIVNDPGCVSGRFASVNSTVHHLVAHPLQIMLDLYLAYGDQAFENPAFSRTYRSVINAGALALKTSLFDNSSDSEAVMWSEIDSDYIDQTYPDCYRVDPSCRENGAIGDDTSPSDVSHSSNFVTTAIELYRAGIVFSEADVKRFLRTFKNVVWNRDTVDPIYADFVDGRIGPAMGTPPEGQGGKYPPLTMGSNIAPGWTALAGLDSELQMIFENGDTSSLTNKSWTNRMAFYASLARNKLLGSCQYTEDGIEIRDGIDNDCDGHVDENVSHCPLGTGAPCEVQTTPTPQATLTPTATPSATPQATLTPTAAPSASPTPLPGEIERFMKLKPAIKLSIADSRLQVRCAQRYADQYSFLVQRNGKTILRQSNRTGEVKFKFRARDIFTVQCYAKMQDAGQIFSSKVRKKSAVISRILKAAGKRR